MPTTLMEGSLVPGDCVNGVFGVVWAVAVVVMKALSRKVQQSWRLSREGGMVGLSQAEGKVYVDSVGSVAC